MGNYVRWDLAEGNKGEGKICTQLGRERLQLKAGLGRHLSTRRSYR